MKTIDWINYLRLQREQHGKTVFTVTELANVAQASARVLNVELSRLIKRGVIARYAQGRYGPAGGIAPEYILPHLDSSAYITGFYALSHYNLVTQIPVEVTCFTNRRHNRSRERLTAAGKVVFVCVNPTIYAHPSDGKFAPPEQSLCDFIHLMSRSSLRVESLVTFRNLEHLHWPKLRKIAARYPKYVLAQLKGIYPKTIPVLAERPGSATEVSSENSPRSTNEPRRNRPA